VLRKLSAIIFAFAICLTIASAPRSSVTQQRQESAAIQPQMKPREIPPEISRRVQILHSKLQPSVRAWVEQQAKLESQKPAPDAASIATAARNRFPALNTRGNSANDGDINSLVAIVMMQAANDSNNDLKDAMAQMQAANNAKQQLGELMAQMQAAQAAMQSQMKNEYCQTEPCRALPSKLKELSAVTASLPHPVRTTAPANLTIANLKALDNQLKSDLDSMNDMSDEMSMRMQMVMDRYTKAVEVLSNLIKKIDDTSSSILQNIK
jgi:DNA repair exonuclease SbcCD ATPase subunit